LAQANLGAAHVKEIEGKTAGAIDKEGWLHSGDKGLVTDAWRILGSMWRWNRSSQV